MDDYKLESKITKIDVTYKWETYKKRPVVLTKAYFYNESVNRRLNISQDAGNSVLIDFYNIKSH